MSSAQEYLISQTSKLMVEQRTENIISLTFVQILLYLYFNKMLSLDLRNTRTLMYFNEVFLSIFLSIPKHCFDNEARQHSSHMSFLPFLRNLISR